MVVLNMSAMGLVLSKLLLLALLTNTGQSSGAAYRQRKRAGGRAKRVGG